MLSTLLKAAVRNSYLSRNPAEGVTLPRNRRREMLFLDSSQVESLAAAMPVPYETFVYLLAYCGLRFGEVAALRRGRVDILRSRVEIAESVTEVNGELVFGATKNYKNRTVVIPSFLRDRLNDHLVRHVDDDPSSLVFTSPNGTPRNTNFRYRIWRRATASAGMPEGLRIHDLRHTAAGLMVQGSAHPEAIKRNLGHSSITVTMDTYGHLFPSEAEAIADRLDERYREAAVAKTWTSSAK